MLPPEGASSVPKDRNIVEFSYGLMAAADYLEKALNAAAAQAPGVQPMPQPLQLVCRKQPRDVAVGAAVATPETTQIRSFSTDLVSTLELAMSTARQLAISLGAADPGPPPPAASLCRLT
jgi:hypothetical protein